MTLRARIRNSKPANLVDNLLAITVLVSSITILIAQAVSLGASTYLSLRDLNAKAKVAADEVQTILAIPLYNLDDEQAARIAGALMSSRRLSGIVIESSATGAVYSRMPAKHSRIIPPVTMEIRHNGFNVGRVILQFSDQEIVSTLRLYLLVTLVVITTSVGAHVLVARLLVHRVIRRTLGGVSAGIAAIAAGRYSEMIPPSNYRDIDAFIGLLNDMAGQIEAKNRQLVEINEGLEIRVSQRTEELEKSLRDLRRLQSRLVESEKMSVLGQLSAGVAHELNTPLGAISSSVESVIAICESQAGRVAELGTRYGQKGVELFEKFLEMRPAKDAVLELDMSGRKELRRLTSILESAGVRDSDGAAAEAILDSGLAPRVEELLPYADFDRSGEAMCIAASVAALLRMAYLIKVSVRRGGAVVDALRSYLRPEEPGVIEIVDIAHDIRQVLTLMQSALKQGVTVETDLENALVPGSSDSLTQIWVNLIRNAIQAMNFSGKLVITSRVDGPVVIVSFIDDGPGIPQKDISLVFQPFYTTKETGVGMGLGLDICSRIAESHGGTIDVDSRRGRTEFRVTLPVQEPEEMKDGQGSDHLR